MSDRRELRTWPQIAGHLGLSTRAGPAEKTAVNGLGSLATSREAKFAVFDGHLWHAVLVSALYAMLFAEAVILEVACRFDTYGEKAMVAAPIVFCWVLVTFLLALASDRWRTSQAKPGGQALFIFISYGSALLVQIS